MSNDDLIEKAKEAGFDVHGKWWLAGDSDYSNLTKFASLIEANQSARIAELGRKVHQLEVGMNETIQRLKIAEAQLASMDELEPALKIYENLMADEDEPDALERLRFFCSLAMNGQDWLDVEPFFNDVESANPVNQELLKG